MKTIYSIIILCIINLIGCQEVSEQKKLVDYVDPIIGTAPSKTISSLKHGHGKENNAQVIPSVTMPFGMTNWTPQTKHIEKKCVAPYYYVDSLISGFRGSHWLSGSCTQDYGSFTIMPLNSLENILPAKRASKFSHNQEISTPYYYKVMLEDYNIQTEITATKRTGLLKFTFLSENGAIVIEPNSDESEGYIKVIPEKNEIVGYNPAHRIYQGWGESAGFSGYFVAKFDAPFKEFGVFDGEKKLDGKFEISNVPRLAAYATFENIVSKTLNVKIGTSFTSIEEARKNLEEETKELDFEAAKLTLKHTWEDMLSKVKISSNSESEKTKFYTALYHSFLQPRLFNDVSGTYPSFSGGDSIVTTSGNYYTDFSIWDTYRASHPLFNLLLPEYSADMINSLFAMAEQGEWLPIFPCWNNYTSAMIGDHAISVIADAYIKGIIDIKEFQYSYLKKNATQSPDSFDDYVNGKGRRALKSYLKFGYVPLEDEVKESFHFKEQVSRTLEYAYDDFAIAQIAKKMGNKEDYEYFKKRSKNYINVYDPSVKSVNGKYENGSFTKEFIKTERMPYITEGTPWQYTWYVPHDVEGLIELMGGVDEFNANLDEFFEANQYWHGNEPGHQIPFLYIYSGQPEKTQKVVSQILKEEYSNEPGGLSGNDDAGQMSAWYAFASMGLYPVSPGKDEYALTVPAFDQIEILLSNNKVLTISALGKNKGKNKLSVIKFNNEILEKNLISHSSLMSGGHLEFILE